VSTGADPPGIRHEPETGQKNLLPRAVLRDLDTTLTSEAANALRDRICWALHQGTEHQYAERPGAGRRRGAGHLP